MSILLLDGVDHYANATDLSYSGFSIGGAPAFVTGRYGRGSALSLPADIDSVQMEFASANEVYTGFCLKLTGISTSTLQIFALLEASFSQLSLYVLPSGHLSIYRGDNDRLGVASSKGRLVKGTSYYIELYAKIHNGVGQYEVWVDGVSVMAQTNVDTQDTGTALVDSMVFIGSTDIGPVSDDIYVVDTTGSAPYNTRLGEIEVDTLRPNAAGASTDWSPSAGANYAAVDDPTPDAEATYVDAVAIGDTDHYNFSNLAVEYDTIFGVQIKALAKTTGTGNLQNQVISNSVEAAGVTYALTTSYVYYTNLFLEDPDTVAAWDFNAVNAMQAGVEVIA